MSSGVFRQDETFGWEPSVPEPFWVKVSDPWWRFWRRVWRPACYECSHRYGLPPFEDRDEYETHWLRWHYRGDDT